MQWEQQQYTQQRAGTQHAYVYKYIHMCNARDITAARAFTRQQTRNCQLHAVGKTVLVFVLQVATMKSKSKNALVATMQLSRTHRGIYVHMYINIYIYMSRQAKEQWLLTIDEFLWRFYPLSIDYSLYIHYICWDTCVGNMALAHECCFGNSNYNKMKKIEK